MSVSLASAGTYGIAYRLRPHTTNQGQHEEHVGRLVPGLMVCSQGVCVSQSQSLCLPGWLLRRAVARKIKKNPASVWVSVFLSCLFTMEFAHEPDCSLSISYI